jgi:hypothetical protein
VIHQALHFGGCDFWQSFFFEDLFIGGKIRPCWLFSIDHFSEEWKSWMVDSCEFQPGEFSFWNFISGNN